MARPEVPQGAVTVFTDVLCGWSTVALHRFYRARASAGLADRLDVDLQLFLLEDVNEKPLTWRVIELEKPVAGSLAEDLRFSSWQRDLSEYPVTSLPANEAVHAAKQQSPAAAEQLDMALRTAFWRDSRCISLRHEILDVAAGCDRVDVDRLRQALDAGLARGPMMRTYLACRDAVQGSPHFFLRDGTDVHNPGARIHQAGPPGRGFVVVDADDPSVFDELVQRAADSAQRPVGSSRQGS